MILRIAIDGASKGNGKDNCIGGAGVAIYNMETCKIRKLQAVEVGSTNQRAELLALHTVLKYILKVWNDPDDEIQIITDSEYIFNMFTKQWYNSWRNNNWRNKENEAVKNKELIESIVTLYEEVVSEITFYHIKGHVIPIGVVTANNMMNDKSNVRLLYDFFYDKYEKITYTRSELIKHAQDLSVRNNGFMLSEEVFKEFVVLNCVADVVAANALLLANNPQGALDTSK